MPRYLLIMVLNLFFIFSALALPQAWAQPPRKMGLAGAGRSGILQEAIFTNPAALTYLTQSLAYGYYGSPRINDWDASGKQITVGAYDGANEYAKAGFAFEKVSHPVLLAGGNRAYRDRKTFILGLGRELTNFLDLGITGKYVYRKDGGDEKKFFNGDVGAMLKIFSGAQIGLTYENAFDQEGELPPIIGAGIRYDILGPIAALVDAGFATNGLQKDKKQFSYAIELGLFDDIVGRGGFYQDSISGLRGSAFGFSWQGPRTSFDYGLRMTRRAPVQREHVLGITIQI
jgi:hypothetical protein